MPFADELIGAPTATTLVNAIQAAASERPLVRLSAAPALLGDLALRERSDLLRDALLHDIDGPYDELASVIRRAAAGEMPFTGWLIWPVTSAIAERAVQDGGSAAFDDAMEVLALLTPRLTSEFAIRTLLRHDPDRALAIIQNEWVRSADADIRRLASEGSRPFLPWATRVPALLKRPDATIPILNALYRDESEYVRRSVANHLNDLSRNHPALVVSTAAAWLAEPDANTEKLAARALRTLIKRGDAQALALQGFAPAHVEVSEIELSHASIVVGDSLAFSTSITNVGDSPARLSIDYTVHHRKASGATSGKTFKLAVRTLAPGESIAIRKSHSFRLITTRRYYSGTHTIELHVNGVSAATRDFELTVQ